MIGKKRSSRDFRRREKEKLNKNREWKSVRRRKSRPDKSKRRIEKSTWTRYMAWMSLMSLRASIAIHPTIADSPRSRITTSPMLRCSLTRTAVEQPKCRTRRRFRIRGPIRIAAQICKNQCTSQSAIETELAVRGYPPLQALIDNRFLQGRPMVLLKILVDR